MSEYIKKSSLLQKNFTKRKMCLRNKKLDHQVFEKFCLWYIHIKFVNRGYKKKNIDTDRFDYGVFKFNV